MSGKEFLKEIAALKSEIKRLKKAIAEAAPSLETLLRRRGFRIYRKEPHEDLLIPAERFIDSYYKKLQKYSFRLFLRDVIKHQSEFTIQDVTRYAAPQVTGEYINYLAGIGLIETKGARSIPVRSGASNAVKGQGEYYLKMKPVKSFGPTLEWFLSEIFKREFFIEAIWGLKFKRPKVGGDYDLIAKIDGSLLYMEIKSSPPKQIYSNEIAAFFDRVFDLIPDISIFFMDTELRMKDKIVPMFEAEIRRRRAEDIEAYYGETDIQVKRLEKELFHIERKTYIINSKDSILNNLEKILINYFRGV